MAHATSTDQSRSRYRVGDLEVDLARAQVTRNGADVPLPKLSFDVLVALIEVAPAIATTDALLDRVWSGLVVNPETVSQRIKLLRAALGDDPKQPRYISVVRGRGYRLVAEVARIEVGTAGDEPQPAIPLAAPAGWQPQRWPKRLLLAGTAVLVLIAAGVTVLMLAQRDETPAVPRETAAPPELAQRSVAVLPFDNLSADPADAVFASGIAEAVLHQLATLRELVVIARTSSFAVGKVGDAREVGRQLGVRYLLQGSVQRADKRLRVTARLVDCATGSHIWSLQIDRTQQDIFAVEDEIALKVARAFKLSLDSSATDRLTGQGTTNFDAYLEYLQARSLIGDGRLAALQTAIEHLGRAIELDPTFAPAYIELAGAELRRAEFDVTGNRYARFETARTRVAQLLESALRIDPDDGRAYLQRGYLRAFSDLPSAESDYRHGLELRPNDASGYEGLAAVLYQDPVRRDEALAVLDRARRLDPLEPRYDVTRAVFLFFGRGDPNSALQLVKRVLARHPRYPPALARYGQLLWGAGRAAESIQYQEQALALDPLSEWTRFSLVVAYLDADDPAAAADLLAHSAGEVAAREVPLLLYRHDWLRAGERAYAALTAGPPRDIEEPMLVAAIRMHARASKDYARAVAALEKLAGVAWGEQGELQMEAWLDLKTAAVGLGDVLQLQGEKERAQKVLETTLSDIDYEAVELKRGAYWYLKSRAIAYALMGDREAALDELEQIFKGFLSFEELWYYIDTEPAFAPLHDEPRFRALLESARAHRQAQRRSLDELRAKGLVPQRP